MSPESRARLLAGFASSLRAGGMVSLDEQEPTDVDSKALSGGQSLPPAEASAMPKTLRERRCLFTALLAAFIVKANQIPGVELAFDEVTVHSPRAVWLKGKRTKLDDAVHKQGSKHHTGEGADLNLYFHGLYEEDGDSPTWRLLAEIWEGMHPLAVSGRRFEDANHFQIEGDRSEPLP